MLEQGLGERADSVRAMAGQALLRWLEHDCAGQVLDLLNALDVEMNESVAELALRALIANGV